MPQTASPAREIVRVHLNVPAKQGIMKLTKTIVQNVTTSVQLARQLPAAVSLVEEIEWDQPACVLKDFSKTQLLRTALPAISRARPVPCLQPNA